MKSQVCQSRCLSPALGCHSRGQRICALSGECGTWKTFKARLWPWFEPFAVRTSLEPLELFPPCYYSECGTYKTVKARFWPWLEGKSPSNALSCFILVLSCFLFARQWQRPRQISSGMVKMQRFMLLVQIRACTCCDYPDRINLWRASGTKRGANRENLFEMKLRS